ncbi:MAG: MoxR-like ATPase [Caldanaerobacter subterraneus]|uniref:MoxR-like ATPases n=4 Tax=Caldanaerobacter subterraneus TaxID=911092 RepID=Q8R822_CALS4|nr:MoxR-like ATPases [Caldanaerobacter subterraneus subsp. tengcongensis MB4]KUK08328.1 MAG: MoxR-like ATPase [Caldanaerobacter subterraneus]MCS3915027.1 MoxR-like ATPase [Caldanaerobacter subterraneus subsp. tengcongensis MB4]MDI3518489.1 MoxR-like ATPase [Caldanaerobacter sp.]TCO67558.1 MoxR-like ATPase [Caldanaerobacter subterraneus]
MSMNSKVEKIIENIEKVIIGKREAVELVIIALLAEGHVLIEDVPGVGKTSLVKALAKSINASFRRIQFTPDLVPSDVVGVTVYNQQKREFEFKPGPIMSNIVLADEINRTSPKTQSSLLEAMEEKQITVDGVTYPLPKPFMVLATQNPIEYEGTFKLPEAQLDRFMIKIEIGYPSEAEELEILANFEEKNPLEELKPVVNAEEVIKMQEEVKKVYVEDIVRNYIVNLVSSTRKSKAIRLGASPRATLNLMRSAQARAYCQGRDYVLPDDVKALAVPVLSHRIILRNEEKFEGLDERMFIKNIVDTTKVPVVRRYA